MPVAVAWMAGRPSFMRGELERYLHKAGVGMNADMGEARRAAGWILDTLQKSHRVELREDMWGLTEIGRRAAQGGKS